MCGCVRAYAHVCVCVRIDFLDGLAQESDPEGNHLVIWPFDHLIADQCCLGVLPFTCFLCLEAMEGLSERRGWQLSATQKGHQQKDESPL